MHVRIKTVCMIWLTYVDLDEHIVINTVFKIILFIGKPQVVKNVQVYEKIGDYSNSAAKICWDYSDISTSYYLPIKSYTLTATSTSSNTVEAITTVEDNCTVILLGKGEYYITVHATDLRGIYGYKSNKVKIKLQPTEGIIIVYK